MAPKRNPRVTDPDFLKRLKLAKAAQKRIDQRVKDMEAACTLTTVNPAPPVIGIPVNIQAPVPLVANAKQFITGLSDSSIQRMVRSDDHTDQVMGAYFERSKRALTGSGSQDPPPHHALHESGKKKSKLVTAELTDEQMLADALRRSLLDR